MSFPVEMDVNFEEKNFEIDIFFEFTNQSVTVDMITILFSPRVRIINLFVDLVLKIYVSSLCIFCPLVNPYYHLFHSIWILVDCGILLPLHRQEAKSLLIQ